VESLSQDKQKRKDMIMEYKEKKAIGGICSITNTANDKVLIISAMDVNALKNKFDFSKQNNACAYTKLQKDWKNFGPDKFEFAILEELEQQEGQSPKEFKEDIKELEELWSERFDEEELY
jgi:hypothetical protein